MEVHERLNQLEATVRGAKAMPMSASCLVSRAEMLDLLERLREELPANLDHADALLSEREAVLADAHDLAERIVEDAREEREELIQHTDVLVDARDRAANVTTQVRAESTRLLADADEYVDRKLAEFEVLLGQLASQVNNGRLRLTARREADLAHFQETTPGEAQGSARPHDGRADGSAESGPPSDPEPVDHQGPAAAEVPLGTR